MEQKESINMESKSCLIFPAPLYSLQKKKKKKNPFAHLLNSNIIFSLFLILFSKIIKKKKKKTQRMPATTTSHCQQPSLVPLGIDRWRHQWPPMTAEIRGSNQKVLFNLYVSLASSSIFKAPTLFLFSFLSF